MSTVLDFEKPIAELEGKLDELRHLSSSSDMNITKEISRLEKKSERLLLETYSNLSPWQKVQVARHAERPHTLDYIDRLVDDFIPLAGDRAYAEDRAIVGGIGKFRGHPVMIIGHEKGHDTESRIQHNFGMPRPEGYRKVARLMQMANRFKMPIITLVDTAGAHPGIDAEERGQSEALARSIEVMCNLEVPVISVIIGEGMSGGAIAMTVANTVMMLEHSIYAVISPEGCASILWRTRDKKEVAAKAQKLTAQDLEKLGIIDEIIPEPLGGAHRSPVATIDALGDRVEAALKPLLRLSGEKLCDSRREKFYRMGRIAS